MLGVVGYSSSYATLSWVGYCCLVFPFTFVFFDMPLITIEYNMPFGFFTDADSQVIKLNFILCAIYCVFICHWRPESRS